MLVGSSLVLGSALGPLVASLIVETLGYRGLFGLLAGVAGVATLIVLAFVPETLRERRSSFHIAPGLPGATEDPQQAGGYV